MGWELGSFIFEAAFDKLATALRWMCWGIFLQMFGAVLAGAPLAAIILGVPRLSPKLVLPGLFGIVVGGIIVLVGEQKCLHLKLPLGMTRSLPGHYWLRAAYWCHLGSWLLRIARQFLDRGLVSVVLLPMQWLGFVFLLVFLRRIADVLVRRDFKRLADVTLAFAGATSLSFGFLAVEAFWNLGMVKAAPRAVGLAIVGLPVFLFLATGGAYVILLGRMASAAAAFAKYLATAEQSEQIKKMWRLADEVGWRYGSK